MATLPQPLPPSGADRKLDPSLLGYLVLRAFFAQFWLLQWFGKARDSESGIVAVRNLAIWSSHVTAQFVKTTPLPEWSVAPYTLAVPWVELTLGLLFLLGLWQRAAILGAALLLLSLDLGLMLQLKHEDVARNMLFLFAALLALQWEVRGAGLLSLDGLRAWRAARAR